MEDHRDIGQRLDLFRFEADSPGLPFLLPRGMALYRAIEEHVRRRMAQDGYEEVRSPVLQGLAGFVDSGHVQHYDRHMFRVDDPDRPAALKPMNCPGHARIFMHRRRSYRELPVRLAEFGLCHRNEPSGSLHGLMRLRGFVQDDAHIFCREDQVQAESLRFIGLVRRLYRDFGFGEPEAALSLRPADRAGDDATWDRAEEALRTAAEAVGLAVRVQPGEGAFYGPKIEFALADARGRRWQCGTLQADFVLPGRLGCSYDAENGGREVPVLLHRAALGSLERFIGILLEHHGATLPAWLAPEHAVVAPVGEDQAGYALEVANELRRAGLRVRAEVGSDRIGRKSALAREAGVPVFVVVGAAEAAVREVSVKHGNINRRVALAQAVAEIAALAAPPR